MATSEPHPHQPSVLLDRWQARGGFGSRTVFDALRALPLPTIELPKSQTPHFMLLHNSED
eukprot:1151410-Pyramimonas_sp.AAC.1